MREIPKDLWAEVLEVVTSIAWGADGDDPAPNISESGVSRLRAIYTRQENLGRPEPFLTEALADYTDNAAEAVALYRLALAQVAGYSEEPTHTKRICMASRLIELGDLAGAHSELLLGRAEAQRLSDRDYIELANELLAKVAV